MIINSVTSTPADYLVVNLETNNIAAVNAQVARDAEATAAANARLAANESERLDMQRMRDALDRRIQQDVQAGIISESDAAAVRKTLDEIDAQNRADETAAADAAQSNNAASVQAGTSGSTDSTAIRTVLTETVTITGPLKTTVTTYTDGTSETTTTVATPQDALTYGQQSSDATAANTAANTIAMQYLATIEAGTLFVQMA